MNGMQSVRGEAAPLVCRRSASHDRRSGGNAPVVRDEASPCGYIYWILSLNKGVQYERDDDRP